MAKKENINVIDLQNITKLAKKQVMTEFKKELIEIMKKASDEATLLFQSSVYENALINILNLANEFERKYSV